MFNFFNIVERIVQLAAFDDVASTLLLVWTGLNSAYSEDTKGDTKCRKRGSFGALRVTQGY